MKVSQTVFELQSGHGFVTDRHDFVTERRPGQKQYVSQRYGGGGGDIKTFNLKFQSP